MRRLETIADLERAREVLQRRNPAELSAFLVSLAHVSGPIGDHIRTFILSDDQAALVESIHERIQRINRRTHGRKIAVALDFIVDSIERLILPRDPGTAFDLLIEVYEADAVAIENSGDHDWDVTCAYTRAAAVMASAAGQLPRGAVETAIRALMAEDSYGVRKSLGAILLSGAE